MGIDNSRPQLPLLPKRCPRCTRHITSEEPFCTCGFDLLHGSVKLQKTGKCAYCGFQGSLSGEHVFGDWLRRRYNKPAGKRQHRLVRARSLAFFEEEDLADNVEPMVKLQPYGNIVFNVCEECNNTWMSEIHTAAAPVVSSMADGFWPVLSDDECFALARWVAMIVINLETKARIHTVSPHQKSEIKNGRMPSGWRISAGRMKDSSNGGDSHHRALKIPVKVGDDYLQAQATYFCVEKVVFHATSTLGDKTLGLLKYSNIPEKFLPRRLWPTCDLPTLGTKTQISKRLLDEMQVSMTSRWNVAESP